MIDNLKALVAVIEAQSLTKASSRLYVDSIGRIAASPAVGGRSRRRCVRSGLASARADPLGLRVYEHALPILRAVEDLVAMTKEKVDPAGILRLGIAQGIADFVLSEAVEQLRTTFPRLDRRLRTDWSAGLTGRARRNCEMHAKADDMGRLDRAKDPMLRLHRSMTGWPSALRSA